MVTKKDLENSDGLNFVSVFDILQFSSFQVLQLTKPPITCHKKGLIFQSKMFYTTINVRRVIFKVNSATG